MSTRQRLEFRHALLFLIDVALVMEVVLLGLLILVDRDYAQLYALLEQLGASALWMILN